MSRVSQRTDIDFSFVFSIIRLRHHHPSGGAGRNRATALLSKHSSTVQVIAMRDLSLLSQLLGRFVTAYDRTQVELQGKYSLTRLDELSQFDANTSLCRALAIIMITPLPALLVIIIIDAAPLNSADAGVYNQTPWFWLRVWLGVTLITMCFVMQLHHSAPTLPMSRIRMVIISVTIGATAPICFFIVGVLIGFPPPFVMQVMSGPWFTLLATALGISWLPTLRVDFVARRNLTTYLAAFSTELTIIFVYPVYLYVFSLLRGTAQTVFSLVLPIMKLVFKNSMSYGVFHMEDLAPTTIVFSIDVFHALFLSTAAQKSKSMGSIVVIMVIDTVQMMVAFAEIHKARTRYELVHDSLGPTEEVASTTGGPSLQIRSDAIGIQNARHLLRANPRLREHPDLALPRHLRAQSLRTQSWFSANRIRLSQIRGVTVSPQGATQERRETPTSERFRSSPQSKQEQMQIKSIACTLHIFHMTEFYVLIEFAEVMMSGSLAIYLSVITRLPNRVHYETLRTLSDEELRAMTANVAFYALLELISFIVLCGGLNWKLKGFSSIRQLAFTLKKHWQMAQAMLMLWMVLVLQLSLTHFGSDYSFKFAWLHGNSTFHH